MTSRRSSTRCGLDAQAAINANMIKLYHENYDTMAGIGMTVYPLPGAERVKWAEMVNPTTRNCWAASTRPPRTR